VRRILSDKDWRALAWYLERCWPNEFGRSVDRPLPLPEKSQPVPDLSGSFPMKLSIGNGRYVDADEVMRLFSFPSAETPEELAKIKAETSPATEPDSELFDANLDDLGRGALGKTCKER
jgi:hypothetical protein